MTQSEGFPATIHQDTRFVNDHTWAVGNWVRAAWNSLAESGIAEQVAVWWGCFDEPASCTWDVEPGRRRLPSVPWPRSPCRAPKAS